MERLTLEVSDVMTLWMLNYEPLRHYDDTSLEWYVMTAENQPETSHRDHTHVQYNGECTTHRGRLYNSGLSDTVQLGATRTAPRSTTTSLTKHLKYKAGGFL